jgi:hypothetical protein
MGRGHFGRSALLSCVALASVVGCGGSQGSSLVPQSGPITVNPKWKATKKPKAGRHGQSCESAIAQYMRGTPKNGLRRTQPPIGAPGAANS